MICPATVSHGFRMLSGISDYYFMVFMFACTALYAYASCIV
mgnify:CR=1 FL=1